MTKAETIAEYTRLVVLHIKTEREQKYRRKKIAQLRREFEAMRN